MQTAAPDHPDGFGRLLQCVRWVGTVVASAGIVSLMGLLLLAPVEIPCPVGIDAA